jgi:hypothetical protein
MSEIINVYCDESCHLEHDGQPVMVLGAVWCLLDRAQGITTRLREIKAKHDLPPSFELKWTKVSPGRIGYYRDVLDYFFDDDDLHFRALVADKTDLRHREIGWPRAIIDNASDPAVLVWENVRRSDRRVCLWLPAADYLVVLAKRQTYTLFWTAYPTDREHTRSKLRREYGRAQKS